MQIEDLKTWHWILVGLLAGGLFSAVRAWQGPAFSDSVADTIDVGEFEHQAYSGTKFSTGGPARWLINQYHKDLPLLKDVVVHVPLSDDAHHRYWVTGREYWVGPRAVDASKVGSPQHMMEGWKGFKYAAATPYVPGYALRKQVLAEELKERQKQLDEKGSNKLHLTMEISRLNDEINQFKDIEKAFGGQDSFPTVLEYMKAVKATSGSNLTFKFAWYETPAAVYSLPPLAGFLIIGCAWPLTLSVMQTAGMAKTPTVKKAKPAPAPKPVKAVSIPSTAGVVFKPAVTAAPPPPPSDDGDQNEYRGEFYPVVKATHKE